MNRILSLVRRCVEDYDMIQPDDRVAVGVSGGKDSLTLLVALAKLREFYPIPFTVEAFTLDMGAAEGRPGMDFSPIAQLCREMEVPYTILGSEIQHIIFDVRKEKNPCSMCAKMRRGALHDTAKELGCNKLALGHHKDDAVETFIMNLFDQGRIGCFSPVSYLSRKDLTVIRPLILAEEKEVKQAVRRENFPIIKSSCPVDGHTEREWAKQWVREMEHQKRDIKSQIFGAMRRAHISDW